MFRNLHFFRFDPSLAADRPDFIRALDDGTAETAMRPVGPLELSTRGWVAPIAHPDAEALPWAVNDDVMFLTLGGQDKILPASAVNAELAKRIKEVEANTAHDDGSITPVGARFRKRLKDEVVTELLPRALVKPYRLDGYLDLRRGLVVVDTSSRKAAESFVSHVRLALGSLPALPLNAEVAPRSVLTGWVAGDGLPEGVHDGDRPIGGGLHLGEECELRDPVDSGGIVRVQHMDLQGDEVERHLEAGKQVTRLGLVFYDRLAFTLGEDLVVRKLKFLDGALDDLAEGAEDREDAAAEFDARATLLAGEVGALFDVLEQAFRISKVEG